MDLQGQKVRHKVYGIGTIINQDGQYLTISFDIGEKKFVYPDSFKQFLTFEESGALDEIVKKELQAIEKINQSKGKKTSIGASYPLPKPPVRPPVLKKHSKDKTPPRYSIAFKCNYCDGGKSLEQVGFNGVCSDPIIVNNVSKEKRAWCSSEEAPCRHYYDGKIDRRELEEQNRGSQFICYESQMLRDWRAFAGYILTGKNKGRPLALKKVQRYSLCILTTRDPGSLAESDRYIFAIFLVDDTYTGDARDAGYVTTSSKYKLKLSPQETHNMLFWKYYANGNNPQAAAWGSGLFRYVGDKEGALILRDIATIKRGTDDEHLAQEFYLYFCRINSVDPDQLGDPSGALCM